jgi:hypothetical protein
MGHYANRCPNLCIRAN